MELGLPRILAKSEKVKVNVGQSSILAKSGTSVNGVAKDFGTKFKDDSRAT